MRRSARTRNGLLLLCAVPFLLTTGPADGAAPTCAAIQKHPGKWSTITVPEFPTTSYQDVRGDSYDHLDEVAASPGSPGLIFVHNESVVMRTKDGGCTWDESFRIDMPDPLGPGNRLKDIAIAPSSEQSTRIYLLSIDEFAGTVFFYASEDGGDSWNLASTFRAGCLTSTQRDAIVIAPSDPDAVYLSLGTCASIFPGVSNLYKTEDRGRSWRELSTPVARLKTADPSTDSKEITDQSAPFRTEIDPQDPNRIVIWNGPSIDTSADHTFFSADGGSSFTTIALPPDAVPNDILFERGRDGTPRMVLSGEITHENDPVSPAVFASTDDGQTWDRLPDPPPSVTAPGELAPGRRPGSLFFFSGQDILRFEQRAGRWIDLAPTYGTGSNFIQMTIGAEKNPIYYVRTNQHELEAYSGKV